jgi:hypothetical protein
MGVIIILGLIAGLLAGTAGSLSANAPADREGGLPAAFAIIQEDYRETLAEVRPA